MTSLPTPATRRAPRWYGYAHGAWYGCAHRGWYG
jgi:hypothetical protein